MQQNQRQYIRHPTDIPIQFSCSGLHEQSPAKDVADGGLCFMSQQALQLEEAIEITIPSSKPPFTTKAVVQWCKMNEDASYLVGVKFHTDSTYFAVRMVEQVCHIERYRQQCELEQGVTISSEQAAKEWVERYAADFPN